MRADFADGFRLLAARAKAEGLSGKLRARGLARRVSESPFYRLDLASEAVAAAWLAGEDASAPAQEWRRRATDCWAEMGAVRRRLETDGVSVDIVYGLDAIDRCLKRMETMVDVMEHRPGPERSAAIHRLLSRVVLLHRQDRSLFHLLGANLRMLSRRIVDRSGETGEHYIARDRKEYRHIWVAAAGGGALTVLTAAVKMKIFGMGLPPFPEGLLAGLNYAVSFLLLQAFGLILATKQPAMTAATLASILRERRGVRELDQIVDYTASIVRSQLAAAIGNVTVVAVGAYAFDHLWRLIAGHSYLDHHDAEHVFQTLSPLDSLTVLYAAETGVLLWLASVIGGWFDNWAAYHRLPRAVAEHPLGRRVGRARMRRFADALSRNASGWATSVSLGFLLGMTPAFGQFLGLPLDVRHVTLSTGMLALAAATIDQDWIGHGVLLRAMAGIGVMFVLNLSVSFLLSLANAARAYDLPRRDLFELLRRIVRRFVRSPGQFLLPPRAERRRRHEAADGTCGSDSLRRDCSSSRSAHAAPGEQLAGAGSHAGAAGRERRRPVRPRHAARLLLRLPESGREEAATGPPRNTCRSRRRCARSANRSRRSSRRCSTSGSCRRASSGSAGSPRGTLEDGLPPNVDRVGEILGPDGSFDVVLVRRESSRRSRRSG